MLLRHRGFSLLEMLVAIAILGVSFGLLYQSAGGSVRSVSVGEDYAYAISIAESLLAENSRVPVGGIQSENITADGYRFEVRTQAIADSSGEKTLLYMIDVAVSWGAGPNPRRVVLSSVVPEAMVLNDE